MSGPVASAARVQGNETELPPGFEWLTDEPTFDPERHLALTTPEHVVTLTDLGYREDDIAGKATAVAASAPFRILSDEGVAVMLATARRLRAFVKPAGDRIERTVRGGCYRSRWLRDLCLSPELTDHLSAIYGTTVLPHPMVHHLGHLNFEPSRIETAVDKWHHDTLPLDFVLMVTDPTVTPGGRFEYFRGTKAEAAALRAAGQTPPADRVVAPEFPGPGWAIALHGDMVVHRGGPLSELTERITMVNGYVTLDHTKEDQSRSADLIGVDDPHALYTEWAGFAAWRARQRLDALVDRLPFTGDVDAVTAELEASVATVQQAIDDMRAGARTTEHYER